MEPEVKYTESICEFLKDSLRADDTIQDDIKRHIDNFGNQENIPFIVIRDVYNRNKLAGGSFFVDLLIATQGLVADNTFLIQTTMIICRLPYINLFLQY